MDKVLENRICLLIKEMTLEEKTGMTVRVCFAPRGWKEFIFPL